MKFICKTTAVLSVTLTMTAFTPAFADDPHSDGVAAQQGQITLDTWRRDPATPSKLALVTPGKAYMAKQLKIEPGAFSVSQMGRIAAAGADSSARAVAMMQLEGQRPMNAAHTSQGEKNLARSAGVDAKDYTLTELARMKFAQDF